MPLFQQQQVEFPGLLALPEAAFVEAAAQFICFHMFHRR